MFLTKSLFTVDSKKIVKMTYILGILQELFFIEAYFGNLFCVYFQLN